MTILTLHLLRCFHPAQFYLSLKKINEYSLWLNGLLYQLKITFRFHKEI